MIEHASFSVAQIAEQLIHSAQSAAFALAVSPRRVVIDRTDAIGPCTVTATLCAARNCDGITVDRIDSVEFVSANLQWLRVLRCAIGNVIMREWDARDLHVADLTAAWSIAGRAQKRPEFDCALCVSKIVWKRYNAFNVSQTSIVPPNAHTVDRQHTPVVRVVKLRPRQVTRHCKLDLHRFIAATIDGAL